MNKFIPALVSLVSFISTLAWFRSEYEKETLTVVRYKIPTKKISSNKCFVFLSDMHEHEFGAENNILIKAIDKIKPDAILIGGDLVTVKNKSSLSKSKFLCEKLAKKYKVFYANGNHEERLRDNDFKYKKIYKKYIDFLKDNGIVYLSDKSAMFDENIRITGLDIARKFYKKGKCEDMPITYIKSRIGESDKKYFEILLAHSPLYGKSYAKWGSDISLSGHFHGGTVRIPFINTGLMTPQFQLFNRHVVGLERYGKSYHIISSGLGTHSINIRLNNKPQLVVLDIVKE